MTGGQADIYDEIEDLSQVEIIPPHEMLRQFKTVNVAGELGVGPDRPDIYAKCSRLK